MYVDDTHFDIHKTLSKQTKLKLTLELNATRDIIDGNVDIPRETLVEAQQTIGVLMRDVAELRALIAAHNNTCKD